MYVFLFSVAKQGLFFGSLFHNLAVFYFKIIAVFWWYVKSGGFLDMASDCCEVIIC